MTVSQEDALYDFLDNAVARFGTPELVAAIRKADASGGRRLSEEVVAFLSTRRLAFPLEGGLWLSRRGCFGSASFAILPTRLEIRNGILIPGHRCLPFANPLLLPHELRFRWKGEDVPVSTSEGPPADFYPYFDLFGEEYAPQYIARDNPENEEAFNSDPYEDPPEVSVTTLDMRAVYREIGFVPGDRFAVAVADWKGGVFELSAVKESAWKPAELAEWAEAAHSGFFASFDKTGPAASTEEQIAFAYWYGGERMRRVPAYSLEEFVYDVSDRIETVQFGMESRFWRSGKDIPDSSAFLAELGPPDKTEIEALLAAAGIPISEYVIEAYVRDALFRKDADVHRILDRVVPPAVDLPRTNRLYVAQYIAETREEFQENYNFFLDKDMGPIRQQVAELHTAVIGQLARLAGSSVNPAWLPKHAHVTLTQLQVHAAALLEDLDFDEPPEARELDAMANSLDGMIDTYDDIKEAIDDSLDERRRRRLSVVKPEEVPATAGAWRLLQLALSGTGVWRRLAVPDTLTLAELHGLVQAAFGWSGRRLHGFVVDGEVYGPDKAGGELAERTATIGRIADSEIPEIVYDYDYGSEWEVRVSLLAADAAAAGSRPRCVGGAGAAPPENVGGPLRFRRFLSALKGEAGPERALAEAELGAGFDAAAFDVAAADARVAAAAEADGPAEPNGPGDEA
jgi:hypothetical protein